jgi:dynein heavy chain
MESVIQYLQPGLSTLAWNSMNIDAYLHQVHLANGRLRVVVESVNKVCCLQNSFIKTLTY